MSDAAAFFSKKKKKKTFKFNANLIDAATVAQTVHVDAPALSTESDMPGIGAALASTTLNENGELVPSGGGTTAVLPAGEWDDEALAASYVRKGNATSVAPVAEVLDMKAFDAKRGDQDDIAERLRVEETRAQLAAAREGMEREAQRLKEESEYKELKKPESKASSGVGIGGALGSKWVPPHMRGGVGAGSLMQRNRMGGAASSSQKLDTQNEELFPDLAAAEAILEKQKEQVAYKVPKKTAVGGGATWGSRPPVVKSTPEPAPAPEPTPEPESAPVPEPAPAPVAPLSSEPAAALKKKLPTKKPKKDLSTFKPQT